VVSEPEKPLHVKVAEALGCRPMHGYGMGDAVVCSCDDGRHGEQSSLTPHHGEKTELHSFILRYDTDWSAMGPLIEKFTINLEQAQAANAAGGPWAAWRWWRPGDPMAAAGPLPQRFWGETPLEAVCNFILGMKGSLNV